MQKLRILLLSEQNNPDTTSVSLVGYLHSAALAEQHHVTLVTRDDTAPNIRRRQMPFVDVVGFSLPWLDAIFDWGFRVLFRSNYGSATLTGFKIPFYIAFEYKVWRHYKARIDAGEFDVVMRVTPVSSALPSYFAWALRKHRVPFVIGPLNGGLPWPKGYPQAEKESEFSQKLRGFYNWMPFSRATFRHARAVLCGSTQTWNEHVEAGERRFFLPENGIDASHIKPRPPRPTGGPLRLISVGRFVPFKAFSLGIRAAAPLLKAGRARLTMVGYGPEREALETLCHELQLGDTVIFTGEQTHNEVIESLFESDVMVFPSIREFGGGVVFEALACGVVPVVTDFGGPSDLVTDDIGIRVPLSNEEGTIAGFHAVLDRLEKDRALIEQLSAAGQVRARETFTWQGKAKISASVLAWCAGLGPKPHLVPPDRAVQPQSF